MKHRTLLSIFTLPLFLAGCVSSNVAIVDRKAVGNENIHIVIQSDEVEDRLGVGPIIKEVLINNGLSSKLGTGDNDVQQTGTGSGFLVAKDLWITNYHVVKDLDNVAVSVANKTSNAQIIAVDKFNDLALLQADSGDLAPLRISGAKLGQGIYVIGYPLTDILGDYARVTTGNVSSLYGFKGNPRNIQISAPIAPGNSGGPVVNEDLDVVGVVVSTGNTLATANKIGTLPQGLNFAISPNVLKGFLLQNGVKLNDFKTHDLQTLTSSTGLIWNGDKKQQAKVYIASFSYQYYWDLGNHISYMRLNLIDASTGKTILKGSVEANSSGIDTPTKTLVNDILDKLMLKKLNENCQYQC